MIEIRLATPSDAETIADFQLRQARETEDVQLQAATALKGVQAVFSDEAKGQYWIAEVNGQAAGCLMTSRQWSDWRNKAVLWMDSIYVLKEFRRRGVLRSFYEHCRKMVSRDESLFGIRLYVVKSNTVAVKSYESMGMDGEHYHMYEWIQ